MAGGISSEEAKRIYQEFKAVVKSWNLDMSPGEKLELIDKKLELLGKLETYYGRQNSIAGFFESVGDSLVQAQRSLDEKTESYLGSKPLLPGAFRIPKVEAEIHFSIENLHSKGFNVFIAKDEKQRQEAQQQKISFELVAAPPPPELREQATSLLSDSVIGDALERSKVLENLQAVVEKKTHDAKRRTKRFVADFDRVIVLRIPGHWALLRPHKKHNKHVLDVLYLTTEGEGDFGEPDTEPMSELPERLRPLARFLFEMALNQEDRFRRRRGELVRER